MDPFGLSKDKSTELITDYEKKKLQNATTIVTTPSVLAYTQLVNATGSLKNGAEDVYRGGAVVVGNIQKIGEVTSPYVKSGINSIKDSAVNLYNGTKKIGSTSVSANAFELGVKGKEKAKEVYDTTQALMATACHVSPTCKLPDYLYCSTSRGRAGAGAAVNLWNGQSYMVVGADATYVPKQIYKGVRNTAADIKKMSQLLGGQCSLGFIYNGSGTSAGDKTDNFLRGGAGGAGATIRNIRMGISSALGKDWLSLKTPKAIEIGLSSEKADIDGGFSISIPMIDTPIKY